MKETIPHKLDEIMQLSIHKAKEHLNPIYLYEASIHINYCREFYDTRELELAYCDAYRDVEKTNNNVLKSLLHMMKNCTAESGKNIADEIDGMISQMKLVHMQLPSNIESQVEMYRINIHNHVSIKELNELFRYNG